jgi:hypothetical protein
VGFCECGDESSGSNAAELVYLVLIFCKNGCLNKNVFSFVLLLARTFTDIRYYTSTGVNVTTSEICTVAIFVLQILGN